MSNQIKKFIQDRKTAYSEIQNIEIKENYVEFTEKYDLSHPMCPIARIEIHDNKLISFSEIKKMNKPYFELLYGSIEIIE